MVLHIEEHNSKGTSSRTGSINDFSSSFTFIGSGLDIRILSSKSVYQIGHRLYNCDLKWTFVYDFVQLFIRSCFGPIVCVC